MQTSARKTKSELHMFGEGQAQPNTDDNHAVIIRILILLWFIRLFKPEWIVAYYVPSLSFLKPIPTIIILFLLLSLVLTSKEVQVHKPTLWFAIVVLMSTLSSVNFGRSYSIMRSSFETVVVFSCILTYVSSLSTIRKFLIIYLLSFIIFSIWGTLNGGLVPAFAPLDNEDSFGPYMTIGVGISYFMMRSDETWLFKRLCQLSFFLCLAGTVASFARGAFVSLVVVLGYIFMRTKEKGKVIINSIWISLIVIILGLTVFPHFTGRYTAEVSTIWEQGTQEDTAFDRIWLWGKAIEMFVDHPFFGVGPDCYGVLLPSYVTPNEPGKAAKRWDERNQLWGRAVHNMYFQIISELGLAGSILFLSIIFVFFKKNKMVRLITETIRKVMVRTVIANNANNMVIYILAIEAGMISFLSNAFFFNLLFYTWFWDMLILSAIICQIICQVSKTTKAGKNSVRREEPNLRSF